MSANAQSRVGSMEALGDFPEFDLCYLFDDEESPSEVTVFSTETDANATIWITIDAAHAVPLEEVR